MNDSLEAFQIFRHCGQLVMELLYLVFQALEIVQPPAVLVIDFQIFCIIQNIRKSVVWQVESDFKIFEIDPV